METDLIKQRNERYVKRKKSKADLDKLISLSAKGEDGKAIKLSAKQSGAKIRLLDEGFVVDTQGGPLFYIKKGVLQAFYDEMDDNYVGSVNIGHQEFANFPFLVGQWTKKDLTLVDIGDGRKGLDVSLNLDDNSIFIKELRRNDYSVGVSSEFFYDVDNEESEKLGIPVYKGVDIKNIGIVGEAGNVNSDGLKLKGDSMKKEEGFLAKLAAKYLNTDEKKEESEKEVETKAEESEAKDIAEAVEQLGTYLEEREEMMSLMETMDAELEKAKEELKAANEKLAETEKKLSTNDQTVSDAFKGLKALAAKYGKEKKAAVEGEKKNNELSDNGLGVI